MKTLTLPISSFCKTGSGTTPSRNKYDRYFNGSIPWVKSGELRESIITETDENVTEEALAETSLKIAPKGSVLVAMYGANVGRVGILGIDATTNQAICYLIPEKDKADSRYLFHALQQKLPEFISRSVGGAQPNINQQIIRETKISLPPLEEQRRIAEILDRAQSLISKRREAIAQLDILTQAIFIEMFGDPITNPKGWEICPIGSFLTDVTNGLTRRRKESDKGTDIVLRLRDIRAAWIDFSDVNRISLVSKELQRYQVEIGDLLFIRVNGNPDYVGRCAIFDGFTEPVYFNDHIMRVKTDQSKINGQFCVFVLNGERGKREIASHRKTSAGQHTINQEGLSKINIPLPPLRLQQEFAHRVEAVEKLKAAHRASLSELDALFASLQHRAFRGEL